MNENKNFLHVDIGGGPDIPHVPVTEADYEAQKGRILRLRSVRLAKENPDKNFVVVDPELPSRLTAEASAATPNVHFVIGQGEQLPFSKNTVSSVEINHVFYPLAIAEATQKEKEANRVADDQVLVEQNDEIQERAVMLSRRLLDESEKAMKSSEKTLADADSGIDDFEEYFKLIAEASRVLKMGGILRLAEKRSRIDIISRILRSKEGERLLATCNLELGEVVPNEDEIKSSYAYSANVLQEFAEETGDQERAHAIQPMLVNLIKV